MRNERLVISPPEAARRGLGLRPVLDHEHDRGVRVQPQKKARSRWRAPSPPHGPRRGLRTPRISASRSAGGSPAARAALTLVILLGFAVIVGTLTTRAIYKDFNRQVASRGGPAASSSSYYDYARPRHEDRQADSSSATVDLDAYARPHNAAIRVVYPDGRRFDGSSNAPELRPARPRSARRSTAGGSRRASCASYPRHRQRTTPIGVQYARRISDVRATANRVKLFLGLGVLGGAALALLAGLATARRAMEPIAELTDAAREIERTRDADAAASRAPRPTTRSPSWPRRSSRCSHALDDARAETEATLARQREFVADASHELRTPLTSVLANLELLEETLDGRAHARPPPPRCARASRMRRLVADLLLLARAGRRPRADPAPPRGPGRGRGRGRRRARARGGRSRDLDHGRAGRRDRGRAGRAAPARAEPDGERAAPHRPGHRGRGERRAPNGHVVLAVEDDGPGIAAGAAREGLRALLPRARRPLRLLRARPGDRAARSPRATRARSRSSRRSTGAEPAS